MGTIRNRTKEHLPMVLLTLLSIVQALALELLWSQVVDSALLFSLNWIALLAWIQVAASFLGIVVIWIVYVSTVVRFRWVPTTSVSVYPFVIGILEFVLIETSTPDRLGFWFLSLAFIFALVNWVSHGNMRHARLDSDNDEFFAKMAPATLRDFYSSFAAIGALLVTGLYLVLSGDLGLVALFALLGAGGLLIWQLITAAHFWELSVAPKGPVED